ncbi:MAG: hypothetical protein ABIP55_13115, partial [Tepidisphaeraceae bacterium]
MDLLESRRLLASAFIDGEVLKITGNQTADTVTVAPGAAGQTAVTINGATSSFRSAGFSSIRVDASGGNDNVTIAATIMKPATLLGGTGDDSLVGGGGDDLLDGGTGADTLKGGGGNDTADYFNRTADLIIGSGTLPDDGEAGEKDNVWFDIETIIGGSGDDLIKGHANNNLLVGNAGNDDLRGNYGNDTLIGGAGIDTLNGEAGNDTGVDVAGDSLISIENTTGGGGAGEENSAVLQAGGTLVVTGSNMIDQISVFETRDFAGDNDIELVRVVLNGVTSTFLKADVQRVNVNALGGNDFLSLDALSSGFYDIPTAIDAGGGDDRINFSLASATVLGGAGNDTLEIREGGYEVFEGGSGIDLLSIANNDNPFTLTLHPTVENATLTVGTLIGNDLDNDLFIGQVGLIDGRGGNDTLSCGDIGGCTLLGGDGNDSIRTGGSGSGIGHYLDGGAGDDYLRADFGPDTFRGGSGNDTVDYSSRTGDLAIGLGTLADDGETGEKDNVWFDIETIIGGSG